MFHLLSDTEVILNELLIACRESVDHYEDAITTIRDTTASTRFQHIIEGRTPFLERLSTAIRALGDLPSMPDPDKETGAMLLEHVGAALAPNDTQYVIDQRIKAEEQLQSFLTQTHTVALEQPYRLLLNDLAEHIAGTLKDLSSLPIYS